MESGLASTQTGLAIVNELSDSDVEWLFQTGTEQEIPAGMVLVHEGARLESIYIVLEGLLTVFLPSLGNKQLAALGPGQIVGEMSFLEERPASATVQASEPSVVLVTPRNVLDAKLKEDPSFSARLFKSLAVITSRRLRETLGTLGRWMQDQSGVERAAVRRWEEIAARTQKFKDVILQAGKDLPTDGSGVDDALFLGLKNEFDNFCRFMNVAIGDKSMESLDMREELGARIQRELLPYMLQSETMERFYSKPRGYAGDFLATQMLHRNTPQGWKALGPVIDRCFLESPVAAGLRNRKTLVAQEIVRTTADRPSAMTQIVSFVCGPADEIFEAYSRVNNTTLLKATLIDFDSQALAFVANRRDTLALEKQIKLVKENLVYLAMGRQQVNLRQQDLAYSIGLADYFSDKFVVKLLDYVHSLLRPGGRVILGGFSATNPMKAFMDYVLQWKVVHRTDADLHRLFTQSAFGRPCDNVRYEQNKILYLAEAVRLE